MDLGPKWMTASEAIAWIAFQDEGFASECRDYTPLKLAMRMAARQASKEHRLYRDPSSARKDLARKCGEGAIASSGRLSSVERILSDQHQLMTKEAWLSLNIDSNGPHYIARDTENKALIWRGILFDAADVRREFQVSSTAISPTMHQQTVPLSKEHSDFLPQTDTRGRPGRKPKYDAEAIRKKVFELMSERGEFELGRSSWNAQKRLEEEIENFMKPNSVSGVPPATVGRYVRNALALWRASQSKSAD